MVPASNLSREAQEKAILNLFKEPDFVVIDLKKGKRIPLVHKQTVIGRNPNLTLYVNDISVSSKHAQIDLNDQFNKGFLQDKGAMNGCYLNDQKLPANGRKRLQHNDILRFGNSDQKFKFISTKHEK